MGLDSSTATDLSGAGLSVSISPRGMKLYSVIGHTGQSLQGIASSSAERHPAHLFVEGQRVNAVVTVGWTWPTSLWRVRRR